MQKFDVQMVRTNDNAFGHDQGGGRVYGNQELRVMEAENTHELFDRMIHDEGDEFLVTAIYPSGQAAPNGWLLVYGDPRFGDPEGPFESLEEALKHTFDGAEFRIAIPAKPERGE